MKNKKPTTPKAEPKAEAQPEIKAETKVEVKPAPTAQPEAQVAPAEPVLPRGQGGGRGPQPPPPANRGPQKWNQGNNPAAPRLKGAAFKGNKRDKNHFGRKAQGGGGGR